MRRIRVCELITELRPAGAERCVYELARRLDRRRFDVQVVALRGGQVAEWLARAGVKASVLGVRAKWDAPRLATLVGLLRRDRPDILHTHLFHADLAGRAAASLTAVPHLLHTVHVAEARFRPWQFAFARLTAGLCDRIVCVSQSVRRHHSRRSGLPRHRYAVIPNGIDVAAYSPDEAARRRLRSQWRITDQQVLAAFVGRLDHQKGVDTLLSAMRLLSVRGAAVDLVMAGDGPQRAMVERFISRGEAERRVRWLGFVGDVRGVLSAADVFVMPSRWEGWPLAVAEAMAAGLPVAATSAPGITDLLVDGRTGLLSEPGDADGLAESIVMLARDPALRAKLGSAAREGAVRDFPIEANVAAHEALYERVAATRRRRT